MNDVKCYDCGRLYGAEHGFPDLVVPHEIWNNCISPVGDEGGLLCPSCMCKSAYDEGLENIPARFTSGPFALAGPRTYTNEEVLRLLKVFGEHIRASTYDRISESLRHEWSEDEMKYEAADVLDNVDVYMDDFYE